MGRLHLNGNHAAGEAIPAVDGEPMRPETRGKPGVLVVDDDHLVRVVVQLGLERNGFEVWSVADGRQAIDLYREYRDGIAVVLLDVRIPGLDGPATLDALRGLNPGVRVCFMTGYAGGYDVEELRRRGAAYIIAKPFRLNDLAKTLWLLVRGVPPDQLPSSDALQE